MKRRRDGSALLEAAMAVVLLSLTFVAVAQLLAVTVRQRREAQWRSLATREAANVLERISARPWDELTTESLASWPLSGPAADRLPEPGLSVEVRASDGPPQTKEIRVRIDWVNLAGQRGQPVQLVAWRHSAES